LTPETSDPEKMLNSLDDFLKKRTCLYHSEKKQAERFEDWFDILSNRFDVVIGTRSAIFMPLENPGFIFIDDEHNTSYKESTIVRYNTQDIALKLGKILKIPVILMSGTPSVKTMFLFQNTEKLKVITNPDSKKNISRVSREIIDLKAVDRYREDLDITSRLFRCIKQETDKGNKVLIFINRRGYSKFLICKNCGSIPKCPLCNTSYTFHGNDKLVCHHCSKSINFDGICSKCGKKNFYYKGTGIERIEAKLKQRFPNLLIVRIDSDIKQPESGKSIIGENKNITGPALLLGTQKILNRIGGYEDLTLAAILDFDSMFQIPDFHINERSFQIIEKIASLLRNDENSRLLIQTFNMENMVLKSLNTAGYNDFYKNELENRKELSYPPYANLVNVIITGKQENDVIKDTDRLFEDICAVTDIKFNVLGPSPAPYYKMNLFYRYHMIIKTSEIMRFNIRLAKIMKNFKKNENNKIIIDVDPVWIL
ncbi:MAG: primosomal protein N', partial [Actinobacteria bacterium]|nr:primosomal protein N' [Actinomycetota bacterium]